jgi:hypothetical protein
MWTGVLCSGPALDEVPPGINRCGEWWVTGVARRHSLRNRCRSRYQVATDASSQLPLRVTFDQLAVAI